MSETDYSKIKSIAACVELLKERDKQLKERDTKVDQLTKRIVALEKITSLSNRIEKLERDGYQSQQYMRRESVEFVGLPEDADQKQLEAKVVEVFNHAGVKVSTRDFHAIHRLKNKSVVIAKLVNRRDAITILRAKKKLREADDGAKKKLGIKGKVYVNESFCPEYRRIFGICNALYKKNTLSSSYSINGKIKIRRTGEEEDDVIGHMSDLYRLFGEDEIKLVMDAHKKK